MATNDYLQKLYMDMSLFPNDSALQYYSLPKKNMSLSILAKRLLDSDTKTLVKAGFLDSSLELTDKGLDYLNILVFMDYKEDLVKQARKVIKENK